MSLPVLRLKSLSLRLRPRSLLVAAVLIFAALLLAGKLMMTGSLPITAGDVIDALAGRHTEPRLARVITDLRLPRVLTALLVGAALGMAGSVFQAITRNPLGSPDVIGFTTGAATGAIVQIILFNAGPFETALAAMLTGMASAVIVFLLSQRGPRAGAGGGYRLVLVGIGFGAVLSGINTVLLVMGDLDQAMAAQIWLAGSLNTRTWAHVAPAALGVFLLVPLILWQARKLSALQLGDDMAQQLGVNVPALRLGMVVSAVGLTSLATAAAGPVAFVALAAPHLSRKLTRAPEVPLMGAALMGAVLVMAADLASQSLLGTLSVPIGAMTGLLGGLYLLWLLVSQSR